MKAIVSHASGGPETLSFQETDAPVAQAKQLLIRVHAVAVNFPDALIIEDRYQYKPERPFSPGGEVSGVVAQIGPEVAGFSVGDHVIGFCGWGGMAEFVVVDAAKCVSIPKDLSFELAATLLLTYGTAYYALVQRARLRAGETLLVLGAAGGVGLAAVELGRLLGAVVIAAVSSPEKLDVCRSRGASEGVIYPRAPLQLESKKALALSIKQRCGGAADVVFDCIGGDYAEPALRSLGWEGRYLIVGFTAGVPLIPLNLPLLKGGALLGVFWGEWARRDPQAYRSLAEQLVAWCRGGQIRPYISQTLPLSSGAEAIRALADRSTIGKIVLTV